MGDSGQVKKFFLRRRYLMLSILCGMLYLTNLGGYRLFDVDEPRYAETARQMLESGDWVIPYFNGEYRFEKPVLTYWLIGASYKLFGVNEFSTRLPSAVAAWGTVLLTCMLASALISDSVGLTAGLVLALSIQFIALGRLAITDMPLCFFITACLVLFFLAVRLESKPRTRRLFYLSTLACGLAVLTKGPIALVLFGAVATLYLWLAGNLRRGMSRVPWFSGTVLLIAVCLPWYLLVCLKSDWEFFRVFIIRHNILRFAGEVTPGGQHVQPLWYYLPMLLAGAFPWSIFVPQAFWCSLRRTIDSVQRGVHQHHETLYPLVWVIIVLAFFSASKTKLPTYITPAFPPLAILIAAWWHGMKPESRAPLRPGLVVPASIGAAFGIGAGVYLFLRAESLAKFPLGWLTPLGATIFAAGPLLVLVLILARRNRSAFLALAGFQAVLTLLLVLGLLPRVSEYRQEPQIELLARAREFTHGQGSLAAFHYRKTALVFYSQRKVNFLSAGRVGILDTLSVPLAVITRESELSGLQDSVPGLEILGRSRYLVLLGKK